MEIVALQQELALAHRNVTVRDQIIEIEEGKKAKAAGKESNKLERERKKQKREEVERAWGEMKRKHADEVESWTADCAKLVQQGVKKKDSPPKPKLAKKPKVPAVDVVSICNIIKWASKYSCVTVILAKISIVRIVVVPNNLLLFLQYWKVSIRVQSTCEKLCVLLERVNKRALLVCESQDV
ncbi:hypothetical protein B0H14DRAFT_2609276 [Mycena olivaceomarginata]|nr:hypothetical protein B0H14DRAFT_2609276 [Mycena olivaceomarginata]